ncbi:hypothetical protein BCUN_1742 [Bifidobacterium cuniculi]|uniref:DUF559 domain-containing protein n=2 Tax=Bifidobacterium cuniculi TaxID=1688 RepID=A0A087AIG6_9BIFI|nr:hypothetical protein BCUN_1742 [Bifidobacterium cuniculi]
MVMAMNSFMTDEARNRRSLVVRDIIARLPHFRRPPIISHVTALQYWGCPPYGNKLDTNLLHVAVKERRKRPFAEGVQPHLWTSPMPVHEDKGFFVVQPAVCLAQMASYLSEDELVQVASSFACRDRSRRVATMADLIAYAERTPKFHGRSKILRMRPYLLENTDSPREALLAKFLIEAGIGPLVANYPVKLDASYCYIDLAIVNLKLGLEYQGAHHADAEQMRRDADKHNQLIRRGWRIIYVTAKDFEHPYKVQQFLLTVRGAIAHQAHLLGLKEAT